MLVKSLHQCAGCCWAGSLAHIRCRGKATVQVRALYACILIGILYPSIDKDSIIRFCCLCNFCAYSACACQYECCYRQCHFKKCFHNFLNLNAIYSFQGFRSSPFYRPVKSSWQLPIFLIRCNGAGDTRAARKDATHRLSYGSS